ncbi:dienelactone hydrolase family protein [Pleurocapsales cyanobacterium LEGE 10410]|nr:dienelactone hydrolase family protein [Pleurocapsales cyanobacterium LEGE 10410]
MQIKKRNIGLTVDDSLMRVYVAAPEPAGQYPGILFYGDIFQLGRPITLLADRLAGYGYIVAAPEIFHRTEPIGTAIEPGDLGLMRGSDNARRTAIAEYDADGLAVLEWLKDEDSVLSKKLGTIGFCIGGHLAFRAAFQSQVKATVCCYPTGIHNGELGRGKADTIERADEIEGEVLTVFGSLDSFVPPEGRDKILQALNKAGVRHETLLYKADHVFMRNDGYRYDPVATDDAWVKITEFFESVLG